MVKQVRNIDRTFEKMLLCWEWKNKKKAHRLAMRVLTYLHNGGCPPEHYTFKEAYSLAENVFFDRA